MYFLMCFLVCVFGTNTVKITTQYLTPGYYRPVTGVKPDQALQKPDRHIFWSEI